MSVPIGSDLSVVVVLSGVSFAAIVLYGLVSWAVSRARRQPAGIPRIRPPMPRRYAGCIACEAGEYVSATALVRHQERDHSGGVQW